MPIQRALISVSDKSGLIDLALCLTQLEVEIISTGGTAAHLRQHDIPVIDISEYTGFPELLDGRVKTLHPKVHGGLLYQRDNCTHQEQTEAHGIQDIDLVVVNLYPFESTIEKEGVTREEAIEQIDIGGPSMLRSASKNYASVAVLTDPSDYPAFIEEMTKNQGQISPRKKEQLAIKAFQTTAAYDQAIANYLNQADQREDSITLTYTNQEELRYGENAHQSARIYGNFNEHYERLQGKALSYTNVLDITTAGALIQEFEAPTVAILKHSNPCGVGSDPESLRAAWEKAYETDRQAPFGGVIVCNRPLTQTLARVIAEIFTDVIIAPSFDAEARAILQKKKNLRLIVQHPSSQAARNEQVIRSIPGGIMTMDADPQAKGLDDLLSKVVTTRQPTQLEQEAMQFAWKVCKYVKSNAIVLATHDRTLGIGAGQMSRVDAAKLAVWKAQEAQLSLEGACIASDAMFPFPDGLLVAVEAGVQSAIQPGGSMRDEAVIEAANEQQISMVCTGFRHFLH